MMPDDDMKSADEEAASFAGLGTRHTWDGKRSLGELFAVTLGLGSIAWDVYLLYAPGQRWEDDGPPSPAFWMHQLPADTGADPSLLLNPARLAHETLKAMGLVARPERTDLGLWLHGEGVTNAARRRTEYSLTDVQQATQQAKEDFKGD